MEPATVHLRRPRRCRERSLSGVVGHAQAAIVKVRNRAIPAVEAAGDRLGDFCRRSRGARTGPGWTARLAWQQSAGRLRRVKACTALGGGLNDRCRSLGVSSVLFQPHSWSSCAQRSEDYSFGAVVWRSGARASRQHRLFADLRCVQRPASSVDFSVSMSSDRGSAAGAPHQRSTPS